MTISAVRFGHAGHAHARPQAADAANQPWRQRVFSVEKKPRTALEIINNPQARKSEKFLARLIDLYHRQHWFTWIQQKTGIGSCGIARFQIPDKLSQEVGSDVTLSCSNVMVESIKKFGPFKGTMKGLWRLSKCNPFYLMVQVLKRRV